MTPDVRRYERSSAGNGYHVGFRCGGQRFSGLAVATLSAGGCSFAAPEALVDLLDRIEVGGTFEEVVLEHDGLPREPLRARVAYTLGRHPHHESCRCRSLGRSPRRAGLGKTTTPSLAVVQ